MTLNPPHDPDDPQGYLNAVEAVWLASSTGAITCRYCTIEKRMLPMSGPGWGVEVFHEPHCPEHDDNAPAPPRPGSEPT